MFGGETPLSIGSLLIPNALSNSSSPHHGDPLLIEFPHKWDTGRGPAFDWYRSQRLHHFQTLQYRKERQEPFCHEFVVLMLEGWFCRLERMGDPTARIEAITENGTKAHDVIKLHPLTELAGLDESSDTVMEIRFAGQVDLIHVLAICYAIKQNERSKQYTLQRYNCYFFSWTVILLLARRTAKWEVIPGELSWGLMMPNMLSALAPIMSSQKPGELGFRITRLLVPRGQVPANIFVEKLRPTMTSGTVRDHFAITLCNELWSSRLSIALKNLVGTILMSTAKQSARHRHVGQAILEEPFDSEHLNFVQTLLVFIRKLVGFNPELQGLSKRAPMKIAVQIHYSEIRMGLIKRAVSSFKCRSKGLVAGAVLGIKSCHSNRRSIYSSLKGLQQVESGTSPEPLAWGRVKTVGRMIQLCTKHIVERMKTEAIQNEVAYYNLETMASLGAIQLQQKLSDAVLAHLLDFLECHTSANHHARLVKVSVCSLIQSFWVAGGSSGQVDFTQFRNMEDPSMRHFCHIWDETWARWLTEATEATVLSVIVKTLVSSEPASMSVVVQVRHMTFALWQVPMCPSTDKYSSTFCEKYWKHKATENH